MIIKDELLNIIVCPKCKGKVVLNIKNNSLDCYKCCLMYEIIEGIPIMVVEKAKKIDC